MMSEQEPIDIPVSVELEQPAEFQHGGRHRAERPKSHGFRIALAAAVTVVGAVEVTHPDDGSQNTSHPYVAYMHSSENTLPLQVKTDIKTAVDKDQCDTTVTAEQVSNIYKRLFIDQPMPETLQQLQAKSDKLVSNLEQAAASLHFVDLTDDEAHFLQTVHFYGMKGTYAQYADVFRGYASKVGIDLVDNWLKSGDEATQIAKSFGTTIDPLSSAEKDNRNKAAKNRLIDAQMVLAEKPEELLAIGNLHKIVLGKFVYDGIASGGTQTIALNGASQTANRDLLNHEFAHMVDYGLCPDLIDRNIGDPAYQSFNRGFEYGPDPQPAMNANGRAEGKFTSLETAQLYMTEDYKQRRLPPDTLSVVMDPYGTNSVAEDVGTLLGGTTFNNNQTELYWPNGVDNTIIYEKTALSLARLYNKNPAVGEYYIAQTELAHLLVQIYNRMDMLDAALEGLLEPHIKEGSHKLALNVEDTQKYHYIRKQQGELAKIAGKVYDCSNTQGRYDKDSESLFAQGGA